MKKFTYSVIVKSLNGVTSEFEVEAQSLRGAKILTGKQAAAFNREYFGSSYDKFYKGCKQHRVVSVTNK